MTGVASSPRAGRAAGDPLPDVGAVADPRSLGLVNSPAAMIVGRFGAMLLALIAAPVIARSLGPDGRGMTAAALAVFAVAPVVLSWGVPLAVRRRVAVRPADRADLVHTGRLFATATVLPALLLAFPVERLLLPGLDPRARVAFYVSMALVPLTVSWSIDANVLLVTREYRRVGVLSVVQGMVSTSGVLLMWWGGRLDVSSVMYAFLAGNVVAFLFGRLWVRARGGCLRDLAGLVREGGSLVGGQAAEVSSRRLDQIVALPLLGASAAGLYSVAVTAGSLGTPVVESLANSAFERLTGGDPEQVTKALRHACALATLTGVVIAGAAWVLIPVVFGEAFVGSRTVALVAVVGGAASGVGAVAAMALAAQRKGREMTVARFVGLGTGIGLMVPCSLAWGELGAAGAMALGALVSVSLLMRGLRLAPLAALPRPGDFVGSVVLMLSSARRS